MPFLESVYNNVMKEVDVEPSSEEFATLVGPSLGEVARTVCTTHQLNMSPDELHRLWQRRVSDAYSTSLPLANGARSFLQWGHDEGIHFALVTSAESQMAKQFLSRHELEKFFEVSITSESVERHKPHPQPYERAVTQLGAPVENVVAIEDSVSGVRSAVSAGLNTLWLGQNSCGPFPEDKVYPVPCWITLQQWLSQGELNE